MQRRGAVEYAWPSALAEKPPDSEALGHEFKVPLQRTLRLFTRAAFPVDFGKLNISVFERRIEGDGLLKALDSESGLRRGAQGAGEIQVMAGIRRLEARRPPEEFHRFGGYILFEQYNAQGGQHGRIVIERRLNFREQAESFVEMIGQLVALTYADMGEAEVSYRQRLGRLAPRAQ